MLSYLQKCRRRVHNKKAFTLIEVVVVISIIAIVSSVAVPNAIRYQRRANTREANEHALSFYNALQQSLLSVLEFDNTPYEFSWNGARRISRPTPTSPTITGNAAPFFLYVRFDAGIARASMTVGGTAPVNASTEALYVRPTGSVPAPANPNRLTPTELAAAGYTGANADVFRLFMNELTNYTRAGISDGNFYARIDSEFRVTVVYYTLHVDVIGGGMVVHRDNQLACGRTFGVYPTFYGMIGSYNCRGPDSPCSHGRSSGAAWFDVVNVCDNNVGAISARRRR
jgi:prepilin-type N-terminal cleavage/methylation domain-containing protein